MASATATTTATETLTLPVEEPSSVSEAWNTAQRRFLEDLTPEERDVFRNASLQSVLQEVEAADVAHKSSSKAREILEKLQPFVETIEQYGTALDVISNTYPIVMSPLWGSIRIVLHLAKKCGMFFEKIIDMLHFINQQLPQWSIYESLFPTHKRVSLAVSNAFLDVLRFCAQAKAVLRKGSSVYFRLIFTAFSNQFSSLPKFKRHRRIVLEEVEIAHKTEQNYHRQESSRAHEAELSRIVELKEWHIYEKERSFLHLLHTSDYMFYKNMNPEPSLGTCQWLLRHKTFVKWQKTELNLLLILLEPGCGKSVLARSLVDCCQAGNPLTTLADESAMNICYFFFQDESESRREARYAISAILHQLLAQNDSQLKKTFQRNLELPDKSSYKGLWSLLQELVLDGGPPIVCIIDSLDECEELSRSNFIKSLTNLLSQPVARSRLKVIITCRPYIAIREAFDATGFNSDQIAYLGEDPKDKLDIQLEISQFIERKVLSFQSVRFNRTGIHDDAHLLVRDWIVSKDNQSYLWLSLIFPKLEANASLPKDDLRNLIDALPETVSKAYEKMLKKCSDPRKARNILHIIIAATRPLRLSEVNLVLSIQEGRKILKEADMIPETCLAKTLQELCGYFIRIVEERVYLYHQTAKEFLQKSEGGLTSVVNSITPVNTAVSQHLNTTTVF